MSTMQEVARFRVPSLMVIGPRAAEKTAETLERLGVGKVVVVTDQNLMPIAQPVIDSLGAVSAAVYDEVVTEPSTEHVDAILELLKDTDADGLVAIGGGSPIDAGKAAAAMATHPGSIVDYQGYDRFHNPPLPLVALPTTGGTGSEATRVVVITDKRRKVK